MSPVMQLAYGSVVYFAESIDAVTQNLREIGPSYFFGVPRIWEKLQQHIVISSQEARPWVRKIFESAMDVAIPIAQRTIDNGDRMVNWRDALTARLLR
jgi:long-chain acyl-CoA synthetase